VEGVTQVRDRTPPLPWPVRSIVAGAAGTLAMTLAYGLERRVRHAATQLDYDDSLLPGRIVATIMHLPAVSDRAAAGLGLALRWTYGSAFGCWHGFLRQRLPEPRASLAFGATLMSATLTLFPVLGRTPPPWRWPADVLATSFGTHAVYVATVALVDRVLDRPRTTAPRPPSPSASPWGTAPADGQAG
jgi:hypothetical protein